MITRILVDECLSPKAASALQAFVDVRPGAKRILVKHSRKMGFGGQDDAVWTKKLRPASSWLVVTSDYGSTSSGSPLPQIAERLNLPVLTLYGKLGERPMLDRIRAVLCMWPDISSHILPLQHGRRWRILCRAASGFRLEEWDHKQKQRQFGFMAKFGETRDLAMTRG